MNRPVYLDIKCQSCGEPALREDNPDKSWNEICFRCGMEYFGLVPIESLIKLPRKMMKKLIAVIKSKL